MARLAENSWRVLLKPHCRAKGVYLYHDEHQLRCQFEQFDSSTLWTTYGTDNELVYENHLRVLPLLLRDLTDSSDGIGMSSAHRSLWRGAALRSITQLETLDIPGQTPESSAVGSSSLRAVMECEIPEEVLVHGDFHPGNVLVRKSASRLELRVCDFENLTVEALSSMLYIAQFGHSTWQTQQSSGTLSAISKPSTRVVSI